MWVGLWEERFWVLLSHAEPEDGLSGVILLFLEGKA